MNELPMEILMKIIGNLTDWNGVALVNRRFYHATCSLAATQMCLTIPKCRLKDDDEQDYLRSILNTTRTIKKIVVNFRSTNHRSIVVDIVKKFSEDIQYLKVIGAPEDLTETLALAPNVEHSEMILWDDGPPTKQPRLNEDDNAVLNLLRLKELTISRADNDDFVAIFNRLPLGVLTELTLHQNSLRKLAKLFRSQTSIKKLTIVDDEWNSREPNIDAELFDHIRIECLEWHASSFKCNNIRTILAKQIHLKTLKLFNGEIGVHTMNVIANQLRKLEILSISISSTPIDAVKSISKLEDLKEITLQSNDAHTAVPFQEFAKLDNARITTLNIQHHYTISDGLIRSIAKSAPNLKHVSFHCDYNINTFRAILANFNYVETLHLDALNIDFDKRKGNYTTLIKNSCDNDKLTELVISYSMLYRDDLIDKMTIDYPHLKKLLIIPTNSGFFWENAIIMHALRGFKEMESLCILGKSLESHRRYYDLELIAIIGKRLKFIALSDVTSCTAGRMSITEKVRNKFESIKYSRSEGLKMAIDGESMERGVEWVNRFHYY